MEDAIAGSKPSLSRSRGTSPPAAPAMTRLKVIASRRMVARIQSPVQKPTTIDVSRPLAAPLKKPTNTSFQIGRHPVDQSTSPSASPRTKTVRVCVPAFPPIPATIGMNTASTAHFAMVAWNKLTTQEARNAVPRLMASHGKRIRNDCVPGVLTRSAAATPARWSRSSSACS